VIEWRCIGDARAHLAIGRIVLALFVCGEEQDLNAQCIRNEGMQASFDFLDVFVTAVRFEFCMPEN
jgi:hypothetical protein